MIGGRTVAPDKVVGVKLSVITVPGVNATDASSSSAFRIRSKSLNELRVPLVSLSLEAASRLFEATSSGGFAAVDLLDPPTNSLVEGDEGYFSEFWYIELFLLVRKVALGLDGRYGSTFVLSCRLTFAKISCKFAGIVILDTFSRIG